MLCFILWEVNIMSVNFKTKLQDIVNYHNKLIINWKKNILYEISLSDFNPLNLKSYFYALIMLGYLKKHK